MRTIAYIGGTFDILHPGHLELLKRAYHDFDYVMVALNTDEFCTEYKRKPIMTYDERKTCLLACRYVTGVVKNTGGYDSKPSILRVGPTHIIHGDDWTGPEYMKQLGIDKEFLKKHNIKLKYYSYTKGISTTDLIKRK
jgi:glycerol-3-phosphate cytidylyltransferase